jgi:hypothetical protein
MMRFSQMEADIIMKSAKPLPGNVFTKNMFAREWFEQQ